MLTFTTGSSHPVNLVAFHPAGASFAVVQPNHGVTIVNCQTYQPIATHSPAPPIALYAAACYCHEGTRFAISSVRGIHLIHARTGEQVERFTGPYHQDAQLAEHEGELLAVTLYGVRRIAVRERRTKTEFASVPIKGNVTLHRVHGVSPNGRWIIARLSSSGLPSLIDTNTGDVRATLHHPGEEHDRVRLSACFSPNSERFAVCDGTDVAVYDVSELDPETTPATPLVQRAKRKTTAPKPRVALKPVFRLLRPDGVRPDDYWAPPLAFTPDGRGLLIRRPRNRVQLWDVNSGSHIGEWSWRYDGLQSLAIAPDGLTAVAGARFGRVVVWDLE